MQKNVIFSQDHDTRRILLSLSAVTSPNTRPQACATHQPNVGLHPFTTRQRQQEVHLRSGKKGARASEFEIAIQWLIDAGLVYRINRVTSPTMPLKFYEDFSAFKLFTLDVGLMGAMVGNPPEDILIGESCFSEYKGAFTELLSSRKSCRKTSPSIITVQTTPASKLISSSRKAAG